MEAIYFAVVMVRAPKENPPLSHCGCAFSCDSIGIRSGLTAAQISHRVSNNTAASARVHGLWIVTRDFFAGP